MTKKEAQQEPVWCWRGLAALLILLAAAARIFYLILDCPLDLAPDEAHYWDWSRRLDWSYYSKGPVVAVLIRLGCQLFGTWSSRLMGNEMLAVRLPAVLCGTLLLASLYVLTAQVFRREKLAALVVAGALTFPLISAGSTLMTIDAPLACCWGWALVLGYAAVFQGQRWAWPMLGLVIGAGILSKYTMVLWLPCFGLFLLTCPAKRYLLARPGFWVMTAIGLFCCLPVLAWNAQHGWVSYQHALGHAGLEDRVFTINWLGPLAFVGGQFLLLLGYWFVAWAGSMLAWAPWRAGSGASRERQRPEIGYLWWLSAPVFLVFLLLSLKNGGGEANWPAPAYLSGLVLTAGLLAERAAGERRASSMSLGRPTCPQGKRHFHCAGLAVASLLGIGVTLAGYHCEWLRPLLLTLAAPATAERPMPLRRWDPTCRLRGWRHLAEEVDRLRQELRRDGIEPALAAGRWNLPGELAFYCQEHPPVYCFGSALGDRHSQYDFWRPNPLADTTAFAGRTFILVDCPVAGLENAFQRLEPARSVEHREDGQPIARWTLVVGHGYRGFAQSDLKQSY